MKKALLISCVLLLMTLTGCSSENGITKWIEDQAIKNLKINPEEDAQKFIDEQNAVPVNATVSESTGPIHVTFAKNNFLDVTYSRAEDFSVNNPDLISTDASCYFNCGDEIYADVKVSDNSVSNKYSFSEFQIYSINENGERKRLDNVSQSNGLVWQIPEDCNGTEFSIVPVGAYENRVIKLNSYSIDDNGNMQNIASSTWMINDDEYTAAENKAEINSIDNYTVTYQYDNDAYFVVQTFPKLEQTDETVIFPEDVTSTNKNDDYFVELHKYIELSVYSNIKRSVKVISINGNDIVNSEAKVIKKNQKWQPDDLKLKYNDTIIIETDSSWNNLESDKLFKVVSEEKKDDNKYLYTLQINEGNSSFVFNPSEYTYEHGKVNFKISGSDEDITEISSLPRNTVIYCVGSEIEAGYWLPTTEITIGDTDETIQKLEAIKFYSDKNVSVKLSQPEYGGEIIYKSDEKIINDSEIEVKCGSKIAIELKPWNGFKCNNISNDDSLSYTVAENEAQSINDINGYNIDTIFTEDDSHKPELTINLDKSVKGSSFDIITDSDTRNSLTYSDNKKTVIDQISTIKDIEIKADAPNENGKAFKIVAKMKTTDKEEDTEICYIDDTSKSASIEIYDYSKSVIKTYKTISITISLVDIYEYEQKIIENGEIKLFFDDTVNPTEIKDGDVIDGDRRVLFRINSVSVLGYYVSGSDVNNNKYQKSMDYSKYLKDVESIIEKHPIKKPYKVTLPSTDDYGTYSFTLDGTEVTGEITVKENQKLTLTYTVTNTKYKIKRTLFNILKDDSKEIIDIPITEKIDGTTISVSDYIEIIEK